MFQKGCIDVEVERSACLEVSVSRVTEPMRVGISLLCVVGGDISDKVLVTEQDALPIFTEDGQYAIKLD